MTKKEIKDCIFWFIDRLHSFINNDKMVFKVEDLEQLGLSLRALSFTARGNACPRCRGIGTKQYGNTSTWRGGVGGQAITTDVCDLCWETGREDIKGVNLKKLVISKRHDK